MTALYILTTANILILALWLGLWIAVGRTSKDTKTLLFNVEKLNKDTRNLLKRFR